MTRRFVMLSTFEKQWEKIGLNDNDLSRLQQQILQDPKAGDVIHDSLLKIEEKAEVRELYMSILLSIRKYSFSELMPRMKKPT